MQTVNPSAALNQLRRTALRHVEHQQWEQARAVLEDIAAQEPDEVGTRMDLAAVILRQGHLREAMRHLREAVPRLSDDAQLALNLSRQLMANGETVAARQCLDRLERIPDPPGFLLAQQAEMRWMLGEIETARALMDRAVAKGIDNPHEYYVHAMLLQFTGAVDEAERVLRRTLERWPLFGDAAAVLANIRRQKAQDNCLGFLQERLGRLPAQASGRDARFARAEFEWATFKVLDDLGRHDEAWSALERSMALMHALNPYDAASETALVDRYIGMAEAVGAAQEGRERREGHEGPTPIFIVGLPRSGTTLLDRMLSSHSQVVSAGEIQDFQRQLFWMTDVAPFGLPAMLKVLERTPGIDFAELGARYLEQTQWRAHGRRYFVDKLPMNVRMVPLIRRALPHAPILHIYRDPMDVCYSNFKAMFGNTSPYCYDQQSLAHYYRLYARTVEHWRNELPGAMLDIPYASLVSDPEHALHKVLAHCGLDMEEGCLRPERNAAPVATPSTTQVREPIHGRSIGQWRRYESQLEPLRKALGDVATL